jgi:hypothetical protein
MSSHQLSRTGFLSVARLGAVVIVAWPLQDLIIWAFAFIQPELPLSEADSVYALGRLGWLRQLGFIATGIAGLALALGLSRSLAPGKRVRLAVVLFVLGGVAQVGTGLFKTDLSAEVERTGVSTFSGQMHQVFGLLSFLMLVSALFVVRGVFARDPRWQGTSRFTRWIAWWMVIGFVAVLFGGGIAQRLVFLPLDVWGVMVGWRMRQLGPAMAERAYQEPAPQPD